MDKYVLEKKIGEGSYGNVFIVRCKADSKKYVLKRIPLTKLSAKEKQASMQEVKILERLQHPYIVSFKDSFLDNHDQDLCIVMTYCDGGDLSGRIKSAAGRNFSEDLVMNWFSQIALAIEFLHTKKILHRDIKTQNIFMTKEGVVKVGDFGIAKVLDKTVDLARTAIGTPLYMSPEACSSKPYSFKSDVWACGCVLYEMSTLKHAFNANDLNGLVMKIMRGVVPSVPHTYSPKLNELIKRMLAKDPRDRPSIRDIVQLPVMRKHLTNLVLTRFPSTYFAEEDTACRSAYDLLAEQDQKEVTNLKRQLTTMSILIQRPPSTSTPPVLGPPPAAAAAGSGISSHPPSRPPSSQGGAPPAPPKIQPEEKDKAAAAADPKQIKRELKNEKDEKDRIQLALEKLRVEKQWRQQQAEERKKRMERIYSEQREKEKQLELHYKEKLQKAEEQRLKMVGIGGGGKNEISPSAGAKPSPYGRAAPHSVAASPTPTPRKHSHSPSHSPSGWQAGEKAPPSLLVPAAGGGKAQPPPPPLVKPDGKKQQQHRSSVESVGCDELLSAARGTPGGGGDMGGGIPGRPKSPKVHFGAVYDHSAAQRQVERKRELAKLEEIRKEREEWEEKVRQLEKAAEKEKRAIAHLAKDSSIEHSPAGRLVGGAQLKPHLPLPDLVTPRRHRSFIDQPQKSIDRPILPSKLPSSGDVKSPRVPSPPPDYYLRKGGVGGDLNERPLRPYGIQQVTPSVVITPPAARDRLNNVAPSPRPSYEYPISQKERVLIEKERRRKAEEEREKERLKMAARDAFAERKQAVERHMRDYQESDGPQPKPPAPPPPPAAAVYRRSVSHSPPPQPLSHHQHQQAAVVGMVNPSGQPQPPRLSQPVTVPPPGRIFSNRHNMENENEINFLDPSIAQDAVSEISTEDDYARDDEMIAEYEKQLQQKTQRINLLEASLRYIPKAVSDSENESEEATEPVFVRRDEGHPSHPSQSQHDEDEEVPEGSQAGKLSQRMRNLQQRCITALGRDVFERAYHFLKARNANPPEDDDEEEILREQLVEIMGEDKVRYSGLVDQYLFIEESLYSQ